MRRWASSDSVSPWMSVEKNAPVAIDYTSRASHFQICSRKIVSSIWDFGTITIRNPSSVSHGDQDWLYAVQILVFLQTPIFKDFLEKTPSRSMTSSGSRSCSATWALLFKNPALTVDWPYLVDSRGTMVTIASLYELNCCRWTVM